MKKYIPLLLIACIIIIISVSIFVSFRVEKVYSKDTNYSSSNNQKIYRYCQADNWSYGNGKIAWLGDCTLNDSTYCNSYDCVTPDYPNKCKNIGAHQVKSSGNDYKAYCSGEEFYGWYDCDSEYQLCGASICGSSSGVKAGESSVGEYSNTATLECCGDDRNEYYKQGRDNSKACCNLNSDIVVNGKCYAKNKVPAVR